MLFVDFSHVYCSRVLVLTFVLVHTVMKTVFISQINHTLMFLLQQNFTCTMCTYCLPSSEIRCRTVTKLDFYYSVQYMHKYFAQLAEYKNTYNTMTVIMTVIM